MESIQSPPNKALLYVFDLYPPDAEFSGKWR
jgi:hypothetical protein